MKPILKQTATSLTIELPISIQSPRQLLNLKRFVLEGDIGSAVDYAKSFKGVRARGTYVDRMKSGGLDKLATKNAGSVALLLESMLSTTKSHKPFSSKTDFFGVEIECCIPNASLEDTSRECRSCEGIGSVPDEDGTDCECSDCDGSGRISRGSSSDRFGAISKLFKAEGIKFSNIKSDGSIDAPNGSFGVEITVLTRFSDPSSLEKACAVLKSLNATVNKSCGLHVHLDARHLNSDEVKATGTKFSRAMPVLLAMVPRSRRDNRYCLPRVSKLNGSRYYAVNLTAFSKFRTIEVRLHSSTTDFTKIMHWSNLLNAIAKSEVRRTCTSINALTDSVCIPEALVEYMTQRTALFSSASAGTSRAIELETPSQYQDQDSTDTPVVDPSIRRRNIAGGYILTGSISEAVHALTEYLGHAPSEDQVDAVLEVSLREIRRASRVVAVAVGA